jgi:hypothetical protein
MKLSAFILFKNGEMSGDPRPAAGIRRKRAAANLFTSFLLV